MSINRMNKQLLYIHIVGYYLEIKKINVLIYATTWMNLKTMWVKEAHHNNSTILLLLYEMQEEAKRIFDDGK